VSAAAALLGLGRLWKEVEESIIIEVDGPTTGKVEAAVLDASSAGNGNSSTFVERDLIMRDIDSSDEAEFRSGLQQPMPAPTAARRLMKARAQQCVVCMDEKEHTFVPPHRGEVDGQDVAGHRFCTDCWAEFLAHSLRQHQQQQKRKTPPQLTCPLCRCVIGVPDVWAVDQELPAAWRLPKPPVEERRAQGLSALCPVAIGHPVVYDTWADVPTSVGSSGAVGTLSPPPSPTCEEAGSRALPPWRCQHLFSVQRLCGVLCGGRHRVAHDDAEDEAAALEVQAVRVDALPYLL